MKVTAKAKAEWLKRLSHGQVVSVLRDRKYYGPNEEGRAVCDALVSEGKATVVRASLGAWGNSIAYRISDAELSKARDAL